MIERRGDGRADAKRRERLSHHVLAMDGGNNIGVSIAGAGVPLVFFHGFAMNNRGYQRCLSYLPDLGFLAVAIDAPGHGGTSPVARTADFASRVEVLARAIDRLGIRRAVFAGHSMGGRSAARLVAAAPERALGLVLIDAAVGEGWDRMAATRTGKLRTTAEGLRDGLADWRLEGRGLTAHERRRYRSSTVGRYGMDLRKASSFPALARAIATPESETWLRTIHAMHVPSVVVNGERDRVVTASDALQCARTLDAHLVQLPYSYHNWLIARPQSFADVMAEVFAPSGCLGSVRTADLRDCYDEDAFALRLSGSTLRTATQRHPNDEATGVA
ncbi:alpha/beta fold hydrolase [Nocardia sp. NPDC052278]|uniref:alpha/beta fold hydrolase n=1 Tax=unclassified Nocardia TaxID=2637762 RepID=UPI003681B021